MFAEGIAFGEDKARCVGGTEIGKGVVVVRDAVIGRGKK
jgi:hypothetical protein